MFSPFQNLKLLAKDMSNFLKLVALRYLPWLAKKAFEAKRLQEDASYWASVRTLLNTSSGKCAPPKQPRLLIVLPAECDEPTSFEPATGNYNYELFRSAQERYGVGAIETFRPNKADDWAYTCRKIADRASVYKVSHLLFHIESNEARSNLWRWDMLAGELTRSGSNVTAVGFLTDGTYELHQVQCSRFQDVYPRSIFIQIDVVPSVKYVESGKLLGPTFLPISLESITRIHKHLLSSETGPVNKLSFIGKLYGYRKKIVRALLDKGVPIAVNPQASKGSGGMTSYLDYMGALSRSTYTINFSRANGTRQKQLKSRMLESVLVGSIPLTDDNGLTRRTLPSNIPFLEFKRPLEIAGVLEGEPDGVKAEPEVLDGTSLSTEPIAGFAASHFWRTLEAGLSSNDFPNLPKMSNVIS